MFNRVGQSVPVSATVRTEKPKSSRAINAWKQALSACTHIERTNAPINNGLNEHRALIERARLQDFRSIMSLADPATLVDPLEKIFNDLKNKNPEVRLQSAQDLRRHVRVFYYLRESASLMRDGN